MKKEFLTHLTSFVKLDIKPISTWGFDQAIDLFTSQKQVLGSLVSYLENWKHIENQRTKDIAFACWEILSLFAGGSFQNEVVQIEFHEGEEDEKEFRLWFKKHYVIVFERHEEEGRIYSIMSSDEDGYVYISDEQVYDFLFSVFA